MHSCDGLADKQRLLSLLEGLPLKILHILRTQKYSINVTKLKVLEF